MFCHGTSRNYALSFETVAALFALASVLAEQLPPFLSAKSLYHSNHPTPWPDDRRRIANIARRQPILLAFACGLLGFLSSGDTFGSGYEHAGSLPVKRKPV